MTKRFSDGAGSSETIEIRPRPMIIMGLIAISLCLLMLGVPTVRRTLDLSEVVVASFGVALGAAFISVAMRTRYMVVNDDALTYYPAGVSILFADVTQMLPPIFDSIERQRDIRLEMKQAGLRWYPLRYHSLGKTLHISLFGVDKAALYRALETRLGKASS
ncbi:MAG: hypothetical protein IBX58_01850 [Roseovarius sp.]|nr:hypothetical protein [Roseovarius sp.]